MNLRAPATPLITIDPYFSVWSINDRLNEGETVHWTGKPNTITGILHIEDEEYLFMGNNENMKKMVQTNCEVNAMSTIYTFRLEEIELILSFTSPLLLDDLKVLSRPVSYLKVELRGIKGGAKKARVSLYVDDDICLDQRGESPTIAELIPMDQGSKCVKMGNSVQNVLNTAGDDIRINWGYFYCAAKGGNPEFIIHKHEEATRTEGKVFLDTEVHKSALFAFAYDDINSLVYFGDKLKGYWTKESEDIIKIISSALDEYEEIINRCNSFSTQLYQDGVNSGGEKYAEILMLAYRQTIAAHKLCEDTKGELLFISKECFSNGCAATVDVTYPSMPLFLLYNPKLIKAMLRPIFKYANTDTWFYEFAPHDAGSYPFLNGQWYSEGTDPTYQMPIEECGNMLIAVASSCLADDDFTFASEHLPQLESWTKYLIKYGADPEHQLCTDDFAGHLAHNCNLAAKAIMGIAGFGIIAEHLLGSDASIMYFDIAKEMSESWIDRARDQDGTFKLTFDQPDTYSMKYNLIWDKIFKTNLFSGDILKEELKGYTSHINEYGMPLDNRATYTKSDWLVWSGALMDNKEDFERMIEPLWKAYNDSESRVPMTDWYDTITAKQISFQNRTVQGGLFMKILVDKTLL